VQDLCTFEDVQSLIGSDVADLYDATALQALCDGDTDTLGLIEAWSRWFETQVDRIFDLQTVTYYLSGRNTNMVMLPDVPMAPIVSMTLEYQSLDNSWTSSTNFGYSDAGVIRLTGASDRSFDNRSDMPRFARGVNNVKATVTFGSATVPPDVRKAVTYLCAIEVLAQYSRWLDKGIKSRQLGDRKEDYGSGGRFSQDVSKWQEVVDKTLLRWGGGVGVAAAHMTG